MQQMMDLFEIGIVCKALMATLLSILILFPLSYKVGLVDLPGGRKKHGEAVPLTGGLAIFISLSFFVLTLYNTITLPIYLLMFWIASFFLVIICIVDDKKSLSPLQRFIAQSIAILLITWLGKTQILSLGKMFGTDALNLGVLAIPFTIFSIIGVINAVNMTDGIDGLAGSVSIAETVLLLFLAVRVNAQYEVYVIFCLIGSLIGFLVFNFPSFITKKRKVFLGDTGSMLLGFTLSWLCVRLTQGENAIPAVLMLWVMALPIMDTIYLIINRKARGVSPLKSDRRHMHHILLQYFSNRQTVLILFAVSLIIGSIGIGMYLIGVSELNLFISYLSLFVIYVVISYIMRKQLVLRRRLLGLAV